MKSDYRKLTEEEKVIVNEKIQLEFNGNTFGDDFIISNIKEGWRCCYCFRITCECQAS